MGNVARLGPTAQGGGALVTSLVGLQHISPAGDVSDLVLPTGTLQVGAQLT